MSSKKSSRERPAFTGRSLDPLGQSAGEEKLGVGKCIYLIDRFVISAYR